MQDKEYWIERFNAVEGLLHSLVMIFIEESSPGTSQRVITLFGEYNKIRQEIENDYNK